MQCTGEKTTWQKLKKMMVWLTSYFPLVLGTSGIFAQIGYTAPAPEKYALLIGIDDYTDTAFRSLRGAKNDVKLMADLLVTRLGFPKKNIFKLLDQEATHVGIAQAFTELKHVIQIGDMVYIHYSGHGSRVPDLNHDERTVQGKQMDSTWVSYGARTQLPGGADTSKEDVSTSSDIGVYTRQDNDYDIIDDEINIWLSALSEKTDRIVFVSDSCHSGTVTRGTDALGARGITADQRIHPRGKINPAAGPIAGVRITACRDNEKAREYKAGGQIHGMFTWFWARALARTDPGYTWADLYKTTAARVRNQSDCRQHPQIEGYRNFPVYGSHVVEKESAIAVKDVMPDGEHLYLNAGSLLGVTVGSVYREYNPGKPSAKLASVTITKVRPTWSLAACRRILSVGDLVMLESYHPDTEPIKITIRSDLESDAPLLDKLTAMIKGLNAYNISASQAHNGLLLQILRPQTDIHGRNIYAAKTDTLPASFPDAPPECWVLTTGEELYNSHAPLKFDLTDTKAIEHMKKNLNKIARLKNILTLSAAPGQTPWVDLTVTIWKHAEKTTPDAHPGGKGKYWKPEKILPLQSLDQMTFNADEKNQRMLTFSIKNRSSSGYHTYLINITPSGAIHPFFPDPNFTDIGHLDPKEEVSIEGLYFYIDTPGREHIRLIASRTPIDIYVLKQRAFVGRTNERTRSSGPPLEKLLQTKVGAVKTRGESRSKFQASEWTTIQGGFYVE